MIFDEFDSIHASEEIKRKTFQNVMKKRRRRKNVQLGACMAIVFSCILILVLQPWSWVRKDTVQPMPAAEIYSYVTLDINPSMEWKLNEQQKIVAIHTYNKDAELLVKQLKLKGASVESAFSMLLENERFCAYMQNGFLEVSVYSNDNSTSLQLEKRINDYLGRSISQTQYHCAHLNEETHHAAQQHHISAGKYRVIEQILSYDASREVEELESLSMQELYGILGQYDPSLIPQGCHGYKEQHRHHHG